MKPLKRFGPSHPQTDTYLKVGVNETSDFTLEVRLSLPHYFGW